MRVNWKKGLYIHGLLTFSIAPYAARNYRRREFELIELGRDGDMAKLVCRKCGASVFLMPDENNDAHWYCPKCGFAKLFQLKFVEKSQGCCK